ncbi:MAG: hypothetical protein AAF602_17365 [Myxococcota bacterium]
MRGVGLHVVFGTCWLAGCGSEVGLRSAAEPVDFRNPIDIVDSGVPIDQGMPTATAAIYAHTLDELFTFDPETLTPTFVGPFRQGDELVVNMTDIAIDFDGELWGISSTELFRINPDTAEVESQCGVLGLPVGLTFTSKGSLYVGDDQVYELDPESCAKRPVTGFDFFLTSGDLVPLPDLKLYWTVWNLTGGTGDLIVRVDVDGEAEVIGDTNEPAVWGLGYADDLLYGFAATGRVVAIDPQTGDSELVLTTPYEWAGATTNPVVW